MLILKRLCVFWLAFLLFPSAEADLAETSTADLEEVVVIGTSLFGDQINALKTPTPILDVPQSVVIINSAEIESRGYNSVANIINYLPGLSTSQGEGHRDAVVFRGVRSTADFFVDGMRDDVQYFRPLYNLEQVEVLKGPNALLFGRGGAGGVLNRVTKKGVLDSDFLHIGASVDTFGAGSVTLDRNFSLAQNAALRFNTFAESLDNHRDFFDGDRFGVNPALKVSVSDKTVLDLSYEYLDHERFIDRGIVTGSNGKPVKAFDEIVFGDPSQNTSTLDAHLVRGLLQHRFSANTKLNISAFYGDYDKAYQNFYASSYSQDSTPNQVTLDGYVDTTQRHNLILSGDLVTEVITGMVEHTLLVGVERIDTASDQDRFNAYWDTTQDDNEIFAIARPISLSAGVGTNAVGSTTRNDFNRDLNDDTHVDIKVFSFYVQDEISLTQQLSVVLGARFDDFEISVLNVPADETRQRKDDEISPRLGIIYKPKENMSLYASYSESFLPRSGEQFANINGSNNQLDPDTYSNVEAGFKWNVTNRLHLTAAVFEIEKSSPQVADNDPSTLDVIESTIQGFEAQIQGQINDRWGLSAGYGYLDGEQVNRQGSTGLRPRELPRHMMSLWTTYQVSPSVGLGLGLTHQDESFINNSNSALLPSYTRIDAAIYFDLTEDLSVQLNVDNVADELYFPNAHSTHQVTVGESINARFSINWRP